MKLKLLYKPTPAGDIPCSVPLTKLNRPSVSIQWEFQVPKMEVPTINVGLFFEAYVSEYHHKIWAYMVQYLHFRILEFPLIYGFFMFISINHSEIEVIV